MSSISVTHLSLAAVLGVSTAVFLPVGVIAGPGTGTIEGTVTLSGGSPGNKNLSKATDPFCAKHAGADEAVVTSSGKLAGVHVGIKNGKAGNHAPPPAPVVIQQKGCMYTPRVSGIVQGQTLVITNEDNTLHNVHAYVGRQTWFNKGQKPKGPKLKERASKAGTTMDLKCDVHPWMRGYAVVTDHPFFDVTEAGGSFKITGVPPGKYTLEAWHPELGKKRKRVTVSAGATASAMFAF